MYAAPVVMSSPTPKTTHPSPHPPLAYLHATAGWCGVHVLAQGVRLRPPLLCEVRVQREDAHIVESLPVPNKVDYLQVGSGAGRAGGRPYNFLLCKRIALMRDAKPGEV